MGIGSIIGAVIIGIVLGYLGKLVAPGRQAIPWWLTIGVGIIAAFIGIFIAGALGVGDTRGIDWIEHLIQLAIAAIGVTIAAGVAGRRGRVTS